MEIFLRSKASKIKYLMLNMAYQVLISSPCTVRGAWAQMNSSAVMWTKSCARPLRICGTINHKNVQSTMGIKYYPKSVMLHLNFSKNLYWWSAWKIKLNGHQLLSQIGKAAWLHVFKNNPELSKWLTQFSFSVFGTNLWMSWTQLMWYRHQHHHWTEKDWVKYK